MPSRPFPLFGVTPYQRRKWRHVWDLFPRMVDILPPGRSGPVEIRHLEYTAADAVLKCVERHELWTAGRFCALEINGTGWMYDIYHERIMNERVVREARGDVLIAGLGLGMILHPILAKPEVRSVRVLENSKHVVRLVMPSLQRVAGTEKLTLEMADAEKWQPPAGVQFDTIWLDCVPMYGYCQWVFDLQQAWVNRYQPFLRPGGYIDHWGMQEYIQWRLDKAYGVAGRRAFPMGENPYSAALHQLADGNPFDNIASSDGFIIHADRDPEAAYCAGVG